MRGRTLVLVGAAAAGLVGPASGGLVSTGGAVSGAPATRERATGGSPTTAPASTPTGVIAGSVSCRGCHQKFYDLWAPSHHGLAMQPYTAAFARENLTPSEDAIAIGGHRYRAQVEPGQGWVLEDGPDGEHKLPIAHVLGGKNVYYFLTPWKRGRLQTLPVAYDVRERQWYDTARSGIRHFPGQPEDEPLHWTDREYTFNAACYSCHVSQLSTNYDPDSDTYHTVWAEPGINCETCHGPGAEHVRVCREAKEGELPEDLKIISTRRFDAEQTNAMCAPCHARMVPLTTGFVPGEKYFDHYDLVTLEHVDFYPDGRDLGENYTYTSWRMSPCLKAGRFDCMHCHTSSGRFRFADDPNQSCVPCHQARVDNAVAHTHHKPDSEGNQCIGCHMPKTRFAQMMRSDHSMRPPTPAATLEFESPNACNLCHKDRDAAWADGLVRQWRSRDYQAPVLARARLIASARRGDWAALPDMLAYLQDPARDEVFAAALIRLLRGCEDPRKWPTLQGALQDPSPLVRGAATEALDGHLTPDSLPALLNATRDAYRLVRVRAAASLAAAGRLSLREPDRESLEAATAEFLEAMRARPDDHTTHYNLGSFHAERGDFKQALACYARAHELDPRDIAPLVNASLVHNALGQNDQAEQSLRRALQIEPESYPAHLNLGMLLGEMGRPREAEEAFRAALKLDPQSAVAAYNLGVIVAGRHPQQGITLLRTASRLRPQEPRYAFALAFYLRRAGAAEEAVQVLRGMLQAHPSYADGYALLGETLVEQGRVSEAIDLYRQAAENEQVPAAARRAFAEKARQLSSP